MPREPNNCGMFTYYAAGNHEHRELHPDPPTPEEAKPFHVMARGTGHIPISYLVFARDADHAVSRVMEGLRLMVEKNGYDPTRSLPLGVQRATGYLADIVTGKLKVTVAPFDTARISCEVNWAANGGGLMELGNDGQRCTMRRMGEMMDKGWTKDEERVVKQVASAYARRCWWAGLDDLKQEARVAVLEARKTFDPKRGTPFAAYARRACALALREWLWRESMPVSASSHCIKSKAGVQKLRGLQRAPVSELRHHLAAVPPTEAALDHARWCRRVSGRLGEVIAAVDDAEMAALVLSGAAAHEVASAAGVPVRRVYRAAYRARQAARADDGLRAMLAEREV